MSATAATTGGSSLGLLLRLKVRLLRNRMRQLIDQSPMRLMLVLAFVAAIWYMLYAVFDHVFLFLRRYEQQSVIAVPYVFHIFFVAMTALLSFSTAVLVYGSLFGRAEPSFLLSCPNQPRNIVTIMFLEAMFFSSWSLILLGIPLMAAIGQVQGMPLRFYVLFLLSFLGFVPIPGALGLLAALFVATYIPRMARQALGYSALAVGLVAVIWWGRLWTISSMDSNVWLHRFLGELQYLKAAMLPSTWVTNAIRFAIEDKPTESLFYLGVTAATAAFFSWASVSLVGAKLIRAYGKAQSAQNGTSVQSARASRWLSKLLFSYLPLEMRTLVLKDLRAFLRDPVQWSQLVILFGLLALYLVYLPTTRPAGFNLPWQALICFLNFGAVTLILSTFTSRFVFPMISLEGRQMWLGGLWPLPRKKVIWAKFIYACVLTAVSALAVTALSIRALGLPWAVGIVQIGGTLATCIGLCGLAIGLGAWMPSYSERNIGRIASGLGGTVNLIASVCLVVLVEGLMGAICYRLVQSSDLTRLDPWNLGLFLAMVLLGLSTAFVAMAIGIQKFQQQEF
jgi:ABC-2 type transport system permease protein